MTSIAVKESNLEQEGNPRKNLMVVKKKSTKTAFEGDILQACRLTDDTITDILDPYKSKKRRIEARAVAANFYEKAD